MSQDNSRSERFLELNRQAEGLQRQFDEALRKNSHARSDLERRQSIERFRAITRSSEDLIGEFERMGIADPRKSTSTRETRPSLQGQPASSGRNRQPQASNSSNTGLASAPRGSRQGERMSSSSDVRSSATREPNPSRQQRHRPSRSQDLPTGSSSAYGQPTRSQSGTSNGQGFSPATGTQSSPAYQPWPGLQQNAIPQTSSWQTPPAQQQSYYQGSTTSGVAPSLTRTSGQQNSAVSASIESSGDEYVDYRGTPYRGSRRQSRDVVGSASTRTNTESSRGQRSRNRSTSRSAAGEPTTSPSQPTGRASSSRHRRSSSNPSNASARSNRPPPTGRPTLPSPAMGQPRQTAATMPFQPFGLSNTLPPLNQQPAPGYQFPPGNTQSGPYAGYGQSGSSDNRYPTGGAPPNTGTMTAQFQLPRLNQPNQQRAPVSSGSGVQMSGTSLGYSQQTQTRRGSSQNTNVNTYQNSTPRRMSTPPLGSNTMPSASTYPANYQPTPTTRRGMSPGRSRLQGQGTPRQSGTLPPLGSTSSSVGSSMYPTGQVQQPGGPRGRNPSPLRTGQFGTANQGRDLTPPRGTRERR